MRESVRLVHGLVSDLIPGDDLEQDHQIETLRWLEDTDDVFRRVAPAIPIRHLTAYVVLRDPGDGSVLLVDHLKAGRWLPPGGHVDPDERPADTARREVREELGVDARFVDPAARPTFLTVTRTVGQDSGHDDVSLWFLLQGRRDMALKLDHREFRSACWWTPGQVRSEDASRFDPHLNRFLRKVAGPGRRSAGPAFPRQQR